MRTSEQVIDAIMRISEQKDINQKDLALLVDMPESTLSRYKNHLREFPLNEVGKFAKALNVPVHELLDIELTDCERFTTLANVVGTLEQMGALNENTLQSQLFQQQLLSAILQDLHRLVKE